MKAKAPTRSSGKLNIQFGLVTVPVAIFNGADEEAVKIKRNMRVGEGHAVKYVQTDGNTGETVAASSIYKVYTTEDGTEITLTDEEIALAMGEENGTCSVEGFFPIPELSRYEITDILQVRPQTTKSGKKTVRPYDKPFALLMGAMEDTQTFALLRWTLRGTPRLGVLTADGSLRVVRWENEVREALPLLPEEVTLSEDERALALTLIKQMTGTGAPTMECEAVTRVKVYAETKAAGEEVEFKAPEQSAEIDLLAALQASVEGAKKASA